MQVKDHSHLACGLSRPSEDHPLAAYPPNRAARLLVRCVQRAAEHDKQPACARHPTAPFRL